MHRALISLGVVVLISAVLPAVTQPVLGTHGNVTAVQGNAFGYHADDFSLFGSLQPDIGPTPSVVLSPNAANSPGSSSQTTGKVQIGPAVFFTSGQIGVNTSGSTGPSGSVSSSTQIDNVTNQQGELLAANRITSACTATTVRTTALTVITNGTLTTDSGHDINGDGEFHGPGEHPPVTVSLPTNPPANALYEGHIHLGSSTDNFRVYLNEQAVDAAGTRTVSAVHIHYLGPTVTGHLYLGRAVCGLTTASEGQLPCATPPFGDVPTSHPFCAEIEWMSHTGISTGFPGGTYRPSLYVTRQAMSAFLARFAGATLTACADAPFPDVATDHPFCKEIKWMKGAGISTGFSDGTYRPSIAVSRQAMSAFLARLAGATPPACATPPFSDVGIGHPFCAQIKWMKDRGVSTGFGDGTYRPDAVVSRQAMSALLNRLSSVVP